MAKKRVIRCLIIILTIVLAAGVEMFWLSRRKTIKQYKESQAAFGNPLMGYVPSAWYNEVSEDISLLYMDITWAELEPEEGINEKDMEMKIRAVDRKRRDYYQYYTGNTWGRAQNYHLCVDSSLVGVDGCLRAALAYLEDVCKDEEKPEDGEKETV